MGALDDMVPVLNSLRKHLEWWQDRRNLEKGLPLSPVVLNRELVTDASMEGWGGLPLTGRGDQGCMVSSGEEAPYKLFRDVGSVQGSDAFSPDVELGGCDPGQEHQHDCRDIYKQAGGYKIIHLLFPDLGDAQLVLGSAAEDASSVCSVGKECVSGPILEERSSSRMVLVPNSGGGSLSVVGTTLGGPICESAEQQATAVLLPGGRSERDVS